jgi:hypothetical protein
MIEHISLLVIKELINQKLSDINDDYLFNHAINIQMKIKDTQLKKADLFWC